MKRAFSIILITIAALLLPVGATAQLPSCVSLTYDLQDFFGIGGSQHHYTKGHSYQQVADYGCHYTGGAKLPDGNYQCYVRGVFSWEPYSLYEDGLIYSQTAHYTGANQIASVTNNGTTATMKGNDAFTVNECGITDPPSCTYLPIGFDPVSLDAIFCPQLGCYGTPLIRYQLPSNDQHYCPNEEGGPGTPIVVDMDGKDFNGAFTDISHGIVWDFFGIGVDAHMAWTNPDRNMWFLVLDRNHNGVIDDAHELFGNITVQPLNNAEQAEAKAMYDSDVNAGKTPRPYPLNGFRALAYFDRVEQGGNADGQIDSRDSVWKDLKLCNFRPPHTNIAANCQTLDEAGIKSISLLYAPSTRVDEFGNKMGYMGSIQMVKPGMITPIIYDVTFKYN